MCCGRLDGVRRVSRCSLSRGAFAATLVLVVATACSSSRTAAPDVPSPSSNSGTNTIESSRPLGVVVPQVSSASPSSRTIELFADDEAGELLVLVLTSTTCPIANAAIPELRRIHDRVRSMDGRMILVHPDPLASDETILTHATDVGLDTTMVRDPRHEVVRMLEATVVPEAFVFQRDGRGWHLRYRGGLDNLYADIGRRRRQATQWYVRDALDAIATDQPVPVTNRPAIGCRIERWDP